MPPRRVFLLAEPGSTYDAKSPFGKFLTVISPQAAQLPRGSLGSVTARRCMRIPSTKTDFFPVYVDSSQPSLKVMPVFASVLSPRRPSIEYGVTGLPPSHACVMSCRIRRAGLVGRSWLRSVPVPCWRRIPSLLGLACWRVAHLRLDHVLASSHPRYVLGAPAMPCGRLEPVV